MKRDVSPLKRHIEESPKLRALREKRRTLRRRMWGLVLALFLVVISGAIYAAHRPRFQIHTVVVSGNQVLDDDDLMAKAEEYLVGNYAYIIPHRVSFLYPKDKIKASILAAFPRIHSISVYRENLTTLRIDISEVRGTALWCSGDPVIADITTPCYFTDEAAKIISHAPNYSGNVYPRFFGGHIPSGAAPLGQTFLDEKTFQTLLAFQERMIGFGFNVRAVVIGESGEDALVLDVDGGSTARVRFLHDAVYQTLADNLAAALEKEEFSQALAKNKGSLEYFDLRFPNKVYYKFAGEN